ncbi:carbonic anhydrase 1-like [Paramacrobiotus metropolitanus]|uniref:carbonic anhydrase 1-like n=1 Tax=Paramacrobiotus metropolitanus TaxID=2943436 RepID=UPI0024462E32|nr:carbonic anhydrase 1-like [Paramacrobiotus metropolitanus]
MASQVLFLVSFLVLGLFRNGDCDKTRSDWGYINDADVPGPGNWSRVEPKCAHDNQQSPIDLKEKEAKFDAGLTAISFANYDTLPKNETWTVTNNGHTVQLKGHYTCAPHIQDGGLHGNYDVVQIHFHWGKTDFRGSEHHVDGFQYPLEMHIVHARRDNPPTRLEKPKQLAVVGVFFKIRNDTNEDLEPLLEVLPQVEKPDNTGKAVKLKGFNLKSFLPLSPNYFRYNGSLTTPPCDPIVLWTVMQQPVFLSLEQLQAFRKLMAHHHHEHPVNETEVKYIEENFRPIIHDNRTVYLYSRAATRMDQPVFDVEIKPTPSSASRVVSLFYLVMSFVVIFG